MGENELIKVDDIKSRIFTIRGMQVMLDSDLAELYNTEKKFLNRAVKRNRERFPESFMFQLTEIENLRFQNGTSKIHGGRIHKGRVAITTYLFVVKLCLTH
jgi:hypothetical protein